MLLGHRDHLDLRDHQVLVARQVPVVPVVRVGPRELQDLVDHLVRPGLRVPADQQELLVRVDPQDRVDLPEQQVVLDQADLQVLKVQQV